MVRRDWIRQRVAMTAIAAVSIGFVRVSQAMVGCSAFVHVPALVHLHRKSVQSVAADSVVDSAVRYGIGTWHGLPCQRQRRFPLPHGGRPPATPLSLLGMATTSLARQQRRTEKKRSVSSLQSGASQGRGGRRGGRGRGGEGQSKEKRDASPPIAELKEQRAISELLAAGSSAVVLAAGKARLFWEGNPVVYGGAVHAVLGKAASGDTVHVVDRHGSVVGWGVFNEDSMYRVRMLWLCAVDGPVPSRPELQSVLVDRLQAARAVRTALMLPREGTDAYRLVNGEGDRLSGLVIDVYGKTAVLSSSARWVEVHKEALLGAFAAAMEGSEVEVVWRQSVDRLRQDGLDLPTRSQRMQEQDGGSAAESEAQAKAGEGSAVRTEWDEEVVYVEEYGVKYAVAPRLGHKTGHYLDQRENRRWLGQLCEGREVLDTFCYSGGFSMNAAIAGATRVDAVDSSAPALALAARNAEINGVDTAAVLTLHRSDVARFLAESVEAEKQWDVVVLDPPKLAPSRKDLDRAKTKYKKLNKAALQCVRRGGLLLSCTCSAAMAQTGTLLDVIRAAAAETGRQVTVVSTSGPGGDHPVSPAYPEGQYLTAYLLAVN